MTADCWPIAKLCLLISACSEELHFALVSVPV
jgi:hypothetical protein